MAVAAKTIAVVGATGAQGSVVVRAILADGGNEFSVRALTRDVTSAKARELAELGAEVVAGDYSNPDGLAEAFEGPTGRSWSPTSGRTWTPSGSRSTSVT